MKIVTSDYDEDTLNVLFVSCNDKELQKEEEIKFRYIPSESEHAFNINDYQGLIDG